jgi:hypothetical protein
MHSLIDQDMVERIRRTGNTLEDLPDRISVLQKHGFPYDREAENVIISGCIILSMLPLILGSLCRIFDKKGFSYTFLSKEYCCGNYLYRPAIKSRDQEAINECRDLSKEFVERNIRQAKILGANRLIIFCSPCYPIYKHAFPEEEIVFYPAAIGEVMASLKFEKAIDYYAGCYRLHKKFSSVPMDLKSTENVFSRLKGVQINRISAPKCCYHPEGLTHMVENVKTDLMVHICTGCYGQAINNMGDKKDVQVLMLPELVEKAMGI